jgi:hypothetical protein
VEPLDDRSSRLLIGLDRDELEALTEIACVVSSDDFVIVYVTSAWRAFGQDNGARPLWGVGDSMLAAIAPALRSFYKERLASVIATGLPWEHDYECSSADLYRQFHLRALVLADRAGLLITHSLRIEHPHDAGLTPAPATLALVYQGESGLISQCGHCRRVRRVGVPRTWDWVPQLVSHPAGNTTHGLCEACLAYYFSPAALELLDHRAPDSSF